MAVEIQLEESLDEEEGLKDEKIIAKGIWHGDELKLVEIELINSMNALLNNDPNAMTMSMNSLQMARNLMQIYSKEPEKDAKIIDWVFSPPTGSNQPRLFVNPVYYFGYAKDDFLRKLKKYALTLPRQPIYGWETRLKKKSNLK